ncbi:hypothetical protein HG263_04695 [Pseudoalteromonas sp. JBTF-M23]|uniref:Uncharacterized protein n=1 Tax=Pseudoalteromonas caenipelagi TaxID=2726988 RepID=A0A849V920_9GAMM|nr:hypothetical protein [Pseudoalteromonas caenipelagi]NOU49832.1 hypothetical protein [Pseudoalteromonas caenipelagi]
MNNPQFVMDHRGFNFSHLQNHIGSYDKTLYISTFNLDLDDALMGFIRHFQRVVIVLNPVPFAEQLDRLSEFPAKYAQNNFFKLMNLDGVEVYFNRFLHAKIIGTSEAVYVGSANFSFHSKDNIEAGFVSTNEAQNNKIIQSVKTTILDTSLSLNELISSTKYVNNSNTVQRAIDDLLPMYDKLVEWIAKLRGAAGQSHPDRAALCIRYIGIVQEQILTISQVLSRRFSQDKIYLEELQISAKWTPKLCQCQQEIETLDKQSKQLQNLAKEDDLYDQLTLEDYERVYGAGVTDGYLENKDAIKKAYKQFKTLNDEMLKETKTVRSYLYALSKLGKHYRAFCKAQK